jgi:hypothetical protein
LIDAIDRLEGTEEKSAGEQPNNVESPEAEEP